MQSMTGFGGATHSTTLLLATVEATSVNRKQLEIVTTLPRSLQPLEARIRHATIPHISRGRIQISLKLEGLDATSAPKIQFNPHLAQSFEAAFTALSATLGRPISPQPSDFLRQPGIFELSAIEETPPEAAWPAIAPALHLALTHLNAMRTTEGTHLREELLTRLSHLTAHTHTITSLAPARASRQRDLLLKRLTEQAIPLDLSDDRLTRELALFADRCDISEELSRLHSHFVKFHQYLHSPQPAGRPLDFLCQELFRELNTIAAKANDQLIAQTIVEAKTELEKIREQVQNIE